MVKSKVTQREETSVAKSSRKGLEKATRRRQGYGNLEACATAVTHLISHGPGAKEAKT